MTHVRGKHKEKSATSMQDSTPRSRPGGARPHRPVCAPITTAGLIAVFRHQSADSFAMELSHDRRADIHALFHDLQVDFHNTCGINTVGEATLCL
jgi:hypothetical protein